MDAFALIPDQWRIWVRFQQQATKLRSRACKSPEDTLRR